MNSFSECATLDVGRQFAEWRGLLVEGDVNGDISGAMTAIGAGLRHLSSTLDPGVWRRITASDESQAMREVGHQCPYTKRGYDKPRGYAGDAVLLDYIYGSAPLPDDTTATGRAMLRWMRLQSDGFRSVRWRRDFFAARIDDLSRTRPRARVASIACGHFREGQRSAAVASGALELMIALDQDPLSLEVVEADQGVAGVRPVQASVRDLLGGRVHDVDGMHLIYAAGLYDYLAEPLARRLTRRLFDRLAPGGTLIVANFVTMWERGWMEALMDWWLFYRCPADVAALADEIEDVRCQSRRVFVDPFNNVAYLEITRSA